MKLSLPDPDSFYTKLKTQLPFDATEFTSLLAAVDEKRVRLISQNLSAYIEKNVVRHVKQKDSLADYKINPYVILASAGTRQLREPTRFASFIFDSKFYAGLETSFGKSVETQLLELYGWRKPEEKTEEEKALKGLSNVQKARRRVSSVWREVDRCYELSNKRFLMTVKSGPNCINDTQVDGMQQAIAERHQTWLKQTRERYPKIRKLDIVIGLTYGTNAHTNNKENQILVKLLERGFNEIQGEPGVLVSQENPNVRVYRRIGREFWGLVGSPSKPSAGSQIFLEILLGLTLALKVGKFSETMESLVNSKIDELSRAIAGLKVEQASLPPWMKQLFRPEELTWFLSAVSSFYDGGL